MKQPKHDTPMTLEQYAQRQTELKKTNTVLLWLLVGLAVIALLIGGVVVGTQLMHSQNTSEDDRRGTNGQFGPGNGAPNGRMGGFGKVTAITESSITIEDAMNETEKTYTLSSDTKVTDESGSVDSVSGIKVGDQVMVRGDTSSSSDTNATSITVNPQMPSGPRSSSTNG